jgi:hypothetical protein
MICAFASTFREGADTADAFARVQRELADLGPHPGTSVPAGCVPSAIRYSPQPGTQPGGRQ